MPAKPTKLYPIKGHFILGVPAAVHYADSKGQAAPLIESGAFTDDPKHPDIDADAADFTVEPTPDEPDVPTVIVAEPSEPDGDDTLKED